MIVGKRQEGVQDGFERGRLACWPVLVGDDGANVVVRHQVW
jgi:hypothetical protein